MKLTAHIQARPVSGIGARVPGLIPIVVAGKKHIFGQTAARQITARELKGERNV